MPFFTLPMMSPFFVLADNTSLGIRFQFLVGIPTSCVFIFRSFSCNFSRVSLISIEGRSFVEIICHQSKNNLCCLSHSFSFNYIYFAVICVSSRNTELEKLYPKFMTFSFYVLTKFAMPKKMHCFDITQDFSEISLLPFK